MSAAPLSPTTPYAAASGLEGIVVADTAISDPDGAAGTLTIRGHDVEALAGRVPFEDAVALVLDGALPDAAGRRAVLEALGAARARAFEALPALGDALSIADGMSALRSAAAHVTPRAADARGEALEIVGALGVFAPAWTRLRAGGTPLAPDASLGHAADFLRMARGAPGTPAEVAALDRYLATVVDHGMSASTFTARVVASTGADMTSAIVAAIGALSGPLHGGAPGPVLDMLDAVGAPERALAWLEGEIAAGRRIMGMGHRVYRTRDPRAAVLEAGVEALESARGAAPAGGRLALARAVERAAEGALRARYPARDLRANVEFYTAVLLDAIGLPRELFSPTFAASRAAGWCAHVIEQRASKKIIRPASRYVGPRATR